MLICPRTLRKVWYDECSNKDTYKLQFQQQIVVNHSVNPDVNGFLIWHEMGTGKTITGLHYLHNHYHNYRGREKQTGGGYTKKHYIAKTNGRRCECYSQKQIRKIHTKRKNGGGKSIENEMLKDHTNYSLFENSIASEVFSYEGIIQWLIQLSETDIYGKDVIPNVFKDKHIVFDEAHELVGIFKNKHISPVVRQWFFHRIREATHFLLLTGTPIYNDIMDIAYLINLCGGIKSKSTQPQCTPTPLIPFSERLFFQQFYKVNYTKRLLFGCITFLPWGRAPM